MITGSKAIIALIEATSNKNELLCHRGSEYEGSPKCRVAGRPVDHPVKPDDDTANRVVTA